MPKSTVKYHVPNKEKWEFDSSVIEIFEDMLKRSIPQYDVMRKAISDISLYHLGSQGQLLDIGCSKGDQIALIKSSATDCIYHGVDCNSEMIAFAKERFNNSKNVFLHISDLRKEWIDIEQSNVILSVLSLQFIPIEYRQNILSQVYKNLKSGGCFILVEKVIGNSAQLDNLMVEKYYDFKSENQYSDYEIERKRLSLEGVLVPLSANWNEQLLQAAGFTEIDCFWRRMNFCGFVAIKN